MSEAYLTIENLSKSYGEKVLFRNISFGINKGQKTALIAKNGSGKSTLLNIINGKVLADDGKVIFRNDIRVAYLSQNPEMDENLSIMQMVFSSDNQFIQTIKEYESALLQIQLKDSPETQNRLHNATAKMDMLDAWDYENRIKEILSRLQIKDLDKKVGLLSGGERKKVALSKVLIDQTDLLILDEPTNHLDLSMIEWLESLLAQQSLALLLVTHDRYFLNNVCTDIVELENGNVYKYKGDYNYFLEKKAEREFIERQEIEKAKNLYTKELDWMRRMPSARATKAKARIDSFYELEEKAHKRVKDDKPELSVKTERIGGKILELYNVSKKFGEQVVLDDFSYTFKRGEKIGIVGGNGVGKSTFLNMITQRLRPDTGRIVVGATIQFGYYTQEGLTARDDMRVIDIIREIAEYVRLADGSEISASQFLNYFGFTYSSQYNYFGNLSGGERRRLYLLKTLIANPNFLILDEPTNDLDLVTLEVLESFLSLYQGCLLIVSHDRSFMDNLVDHIFVFEGNGKVKDYHSNYTEYLKQKQLADRQISLQKKTEKPLREKTKTSNKPTFKQQQEYKLLTEEIETLELEKATLTEKMSNSNISHEELSTCSNRFGEVLSLIDTKTDRWMELADIIEEE